jgi:hypothetical protein
MEEFMAKQRTNGRYKETPSVFTRTTEATHLLQRLWWLPFASEAPFPCTIDFIAHLIGGSRPVAERTLEELIELDAVEVVRAARVGHCREIRLRTREELAELTKPSEPKIEKEEEKWHASSQDGSSSDSASTPGRKPFNRETPIKNDTPIALPSGAVEASLSDSILPPTSDTQATEAVPATPSPSHAPAPSQLPKLEPVSTNPEVEAVLADARKATGGRVSPKALLNRIRRSGLDAVRRQVDWFPYRDSSWAAKGAGAALMSYIDDDYAEPPALAARRRDEEEARATAERKRREAERNASQGAAAEIALANLDTKMLEAAKAEVRQKMGPMFKGEDAAAFQGMLRAKVLELQKVAA